MIDVKELIARYDHATHVAKADAYFEKAADNPYYQRKPLYDGSEAAVLLRHFAEVVGHLQLYPDARLLDFGAGTCWSSRMFAYLKCDVIAADVSHNALAVGERLIAGDPLRDQLQISFLHYDGNRFDLPSGSIDRIVCLDCFHHVADQQATLAEFFRLLRPGGIVGFSEPGPHHSREPQAQFEMRNYGVIENDIDVRWINDVATAIGFDTLALSYSAPPQLVPIAVFNDLASGRSSRVRARAAIDTAASHHANSRIFFLHKPGGPAVPKDSRSPDGLAHRLEATAAPDGAEVRCHIRAVNTGAATWLPPGTAVGQVRVGISLFTPDGSLVDLDYGRAALGEGPVQPGESREVTFSLPRPGGSAILEFDLVADGVSWFKTQGSRPIRVRIG